MRRVTAIMGFLLVVGFAAVHVTEEAAAQAATAAAWTTVFDGKDLSVFDVLGNANWELVDGAVQANKGNGFLVTKASYGDFELKVEFWVDDDANSGVFIRCEDPKRVSSDNGYEVNIYDKRPDPTYATGAIAQVAKPMTTVKAGGKWNTFEITAHGPHIVVALNGTKTVDIQDSSHSQGRIALQYTTGTVKFRRVQIRSL